MRTLKWAIILHIVQVSTQGEKEGTCTNYSSVVCFNSVGFWTQMNTKGLVRNPCSTVYFMKTDIK